MLVVRRKEGDAADDDGAGQGVPAGALSAPLEQMLSESAKETTLAWAARHRRGRTSDVSRYTSRLEVSKAASGGRGLGLKWKRVGVARPAKKTELLGCRALVDALAIKTEFTEAEWAAFHVTDLRLDHFVAVSGAYYMPVGKEYLAVAVMPHFL